MSQQKPTKPALDDASQQYRLISWVLNLPRVVRIMMSALFALSLTLFLTMLVTYQLEVALGLTRALSTTLVFVSTGLGAVMYILGWRLIVGTVGEHPPVRAAALWYILVGVIVVFVAFFVLMIGVISSSEP